MYTNIELAEDFGLWAEYVDPDGVMSQDEFEQMTMEERLEFINKLED